MNAVHAESRPDWALERDAFGKLVLTDAAGRQHVGVVPAGSMWAWCRPAACGRGAGAGISHPVSRRWNFTG
jgi:hypothetical protein